MQRLPVELLQPGMITAYTVFASNGRTLIRAGTVLVDAYIRRLQSMEIGSIYIENPLFEGIEVPEMVTEDTRVKMVNLVREAFMTYQRKQECNLSPIKELVKEVVGQIISSRDQLFQRADIRAFEDYYYGHAVNVAIMSVLTGVAMEYNDSKLRDLAMGALMHDIGKLTLPRSILHKPIPLTLDEQGLVKKHTDTGFEFLRKQKGDVTLPAAHVAFQHHENFDGSGYPRALAGTDISEYARIVAIANIFDALISDKPNRKAVLPHEAVEYLYTLRGTVLDDNILDVFVTHVAIYPVGSMVFLNTGEIATVTRVQPKLQGRPTVKLILDKNGNLVNANIEINLANSLTTFITQVMKEKDVVDLTKKIMDRKSNQT